MITATIASGKKKKKIPQIRLAMAFPLVPELPGIGSGEGGAMRAPAGAIRVLLQKGHTWA